MSREPIRGSVVGAGGYTGIELVRVLLQHPGFELVSVHGTERSAGEALVDRAPELRGLTELCLAPMEEVPEVEVVFLATPHEVSAELAPSLVERGVRVVDLSGAFRFSDPAQVERVYKIRHARPELLGERVYGMPEVVPADWASARLVACAGCYVTAASVPLAAVVAAGVIDAGETVLVDAISGVSGAGRGALLTTSFCEVSAQPYKVMGHRHEPEMEQATGASVLFTPTLGTWKRGILCTAHAKLGAGAKASDVRGALVNAYECSPFVRVLPEGVWPSVGAVERTNFIDIACAVDERRGRVVLFSAIDNLLKGASGQAVQCMNLAFGLPEETGLMDTRAERRCQPMRVEVGL
ncbi:MAG: N-acetyl-gamma-glutamyl-phosphate reductase [Phycisphaerales bacterium]|nr:N-acetyl-gamma-glutamyl-phosphate reductase [Phycisphaerales bacterium]